MGRDRNVNITIEGGDSNDDHSKEEKDDNVNIDFVHESTGETDGDVRVPLIPQQPKPKIISSYSASQPPLALV